jgi:hypothetical protein
MWDWGAWASCFSESEFVMFEVEPNALIKLIFLQINSEVKLN